MTIAIWWHAQDKGRGYYDSTAMLNDMLDLYDCTHYDQRSSLGGIDGGAVVVVHGGREIGQIDRLNEDIKKLKWVLLVLLGDEENSFPIEKVEHPNKKIWIQEPLPGRHEFADRFMINGYGHDRKRHIVECEKDLEWFFGGQVSHERRRACVDALRTIPWGGVVLETKGYYQGVSMAEYIKLMCRTKVVPCPSGPFSQDAARPWDALECGAVPILDNFSPVRKEPGFWKMVLGEHPFWVVTDWKEDLPLLIEMMKCHWEVQATASLEWWEVYKIKFEFWLKHDLQELGVPCTKNS